MTDRRDAPARPRFSSSRRHAAAWTGAAFAAGAAQLLGFPVPALARQSPGPTRGPMSAGQKLEDLVVCYARGTDAIGSAVTAPSGPDLDSTAGLADAKFREGLELYRHCFAPDFAFSLSNRGVVSRVVPDPATRTPKTDPALQWANYVNNAFRGPGYIFTQHHIGSIASEVQGNEARIQCYLIATHVYGPSSKRTGVNVVYGTYTDQAVKVRGRWMLARRTLDSFASLLLSSAP